ncbi:gluconate 2-dehydrogenase subunit 3 family protein [Pararhodonellum marinum]|uniref:gluconate 2-dehydrogenase subunit 3 family protein n=1 Tax=Pararhodonellum marinum TaxID=2755358 RepID=UPI00188FB14F|nr:gluconate 2-dehydrogenase subunit 3 family protein [Pararhodonellum marinum]
MDRRTALKSIAISVWGMVLLPGCSPEEEAKIESRYKRLSLTNTQKQNLESLTDTFIPKTDTLGALDLQLPQFLDRILANCYDESVQEGFVAGLMLLESRAIENHQTSFFQLAAPERASILTQMDDEEIETEKAFYDLSKELVILGYTNSEYFLTNFTNYQMVPGGFDGCVPVPTEPFKI